MASFPEKYAAGSYTVNTAHAKCPDHLYLIDEGSGDTLTDRGKTGGCNVTMASGYVWQNEDLTAGGGTSPVMDTNGCDTNAGRSTTNFTASSNILVVAIVRSESATNPTGVERIGGVASSANNDNYFYAGWNTSGQATSTYDDTTLVSSIVDTQGTDTYDALWHMVAVRVYEVNGTTVEVSFNVDGAGWGASPTQGTTQLASMNRISIGGWAGLNSGNELNGRVTAMFVYKDTADPTNDWDNTFISSLYSDPWQFLNTDGPDLKLSVAPASNPGTKIYMTWET